MATIINRQRQTNFEPNKPPSIYDIIQYDKNRHQVQLKFSCENCYKSKVKCSRDKPICKGCEKRGKICTYERRKPKQPIYSVIADFEDQIRLQLGISREAPVDLRDIVQYTFLEHPPSLSVYDVHSIYLPYYTTKAQLSWKLLDFMFSQYSTFKSGAVHYEFILKLMAMRLDLLAENRFSELQHLINIVNPLLGQPLDEYFANFVNMMDDLVDGQRVKLNYSPQDLNNFHQHKIVAAYYMRLPKPPDSPKYESRLMPYIRTLLLNKAPQLLIKVDTNTLDYPSTTERFVQVNLGFRFCFGLSDRQVKDQISEGCLSFLPYGIAGLALFAADQKELLNYCQTQCLKGYQFDITSKCVNKSLLHESVSRDFMKINFLSKSGDGTLVPVKCEVITIMRSLRSLNGVHDEYYFKFIPLKQQNLLHN